MEETMDKKVVGIKGYQKGDTPCLAGDCALSNLCKHNGRLHRIAHELELEKLPEELSVEFFCDLRAESYTLMEEE